MKRIALALTLLGLSLITYALTRHAGSRRVLTSYLQDEVYAAPHETPNYPGPTTRAEASESSTGTNLIPSVDGAAVELKKAQECLNSTRLCSGYANWSQRDYQIDVLTHMHKIAEDEYLSVLQDGSKRTAENEAFARSLVVNQQPELQLVGIKFLSLYPASRDDFDVMANCLGHTLDEELFETGIGVLRDKYKGAAYDEDIRDMLAQQIQYGIDEITSHRAAQELYQYLNRSSFGQFLLLEQKLVPMHDRYEALHAVLEEYAAVNHFEP